MTHFNVTGRRPGRYKDDVKDGVLRGFVHWLVTMFGIAVVAIVGLWICISMWGREVAGVLLVWGLLFVVLPFMLIWALRLFFRALRRGPE